ncbi:MAG TPA: PDZ domain-containing protein [bacterium]|nr:PDZ domain-containing protein [bacterium]HPN30283.1 PDZ domain-containing protein [bacterium]
MRLLTLLFITFFLTNCANQYKINYVGINEQRLGNSRWITSEPVDKDDVIKIYMTDDLNSAEEAFLENGYIQLGTSRFNSSPVDKQSAVEFARSIGASVVVIKSKYRGTITETIPFTVRQPDHKTTIKETKTKPDGKTTTKEKTITVDGEYQTNYVQNSTDYYDYHAVFWAKLRPLKFGVYVTDLSLDLKQRLQTNRGVVVKTVVKGTPAFLADVLKGDIFTTLNGERINEKKHFFKLLTENSGKEITIEGIRNNNPLLIKVKLN